ncbi:MAG TPA: sugar transferase [Devosiaceae bacterium]|nr:sugar transferase [Devosiaceae bacterium]
MTDNVTHDRAERATGLPFAIDGNTLNNVHPLQLVIKRAMDIVLSVLAVLVFLPFLVGVAGLVKISSPGPVLFVQHRPGLGGKSFPMLKFRTMFVHLEDRSGLRQTVKNDIRLTPIGAFLRKTSIDELPQLINVLAGHMSIVGPRPHPVSMWAGGRDYRELVPYYDLRHGMRPGLSGWAQVNGYRGPTDDAHRAIARINHDLAYIQNFSLALDVWIIVGTVVRQCLGGTGL